MNESDRLFVHRPFHLADPHRSGRSVGRRAHRRRQLAIEPSRCSTMAHAGRGPPRRHRPGTRRAGRSRLVAPDPGASDHRLRRAVGGGGAVECSVGDVSLDAAAALVHRPPVGWLLRAGWCGCPPLPAGERNRPRDPGLRQGRWGPGHGGPLPLRPHRRSSQDAEDVHVS